MTYHFKIWLDGEERDVKVHARQTQTRGMAYDLYVRWRGQRYEPVLGYNLTRAQCYEQAVARIESIQRGEGTPLPPSASTVSFDEGVKVYWQVFRIQAHVDEERPRIIIEKALRPFFGEDDLAAITLQRGLDYIEHRKTHGKAMGTIRRELGVLNSLLNNCVDLEKFPKNRLKRIFQYLPKYATRERACTAQELKQMKASAAPHLWRYMVAALNTGLRESLLLTVKDSWLVPKDDGWWLALPPPRSTKKNHPKLLPLNDAAVWALTSEQGSHARIFWQWNSRSSLKSGWIRLMNRTGIADLRIHDLRHTFSTALQNLGVDYEVRQTLLGHAVKGQTANYSHGGAGWDKKLRKAVNKLPRYYRMALKLTDTLTDTAKAGVEADA